MEGSRAWELDTVDEPGGTIDIAARRRPVPARKTLSFKGLCALCLTAAPVRWSRKLSNTMSAWLAEMPARELGLIGL